jgi:hypothetical protein
MFLVVLLASHPFPLVEQMREKLKINSVDFKQMELAH